jgi:hypothetical protein
MILESRSTDRGRCGLRILIGSICVVASLLGATQASAQLTFVPAGAFSSSATTLTFENQTVDGTPITIYKGVSFQGGTESQTYETYGSALVDAAANAGLGNWGGSFGCNGGCGTGFTLPTPYKLVGVFLSSDVDISVTVSAFKGGSLLGSQTLSIPTSTIGFAGFQDPAGIDQIVIGDNTDCSNCIHLVDNVMFEGATNAAPVTAQLVPTLSQWALVVLCGLLLLSAGFVLGRERS